MIDIGEDGIGHRIVSKQNIDLKLIRNNQMKCSTIVVIVNRLTGDECCYIDQCVQSTTCIDDLHNRSQ